MLQGEKIANHHLPIHPAASSKRVQGVFRIVQERRSSPTLSMKPALPEGCHCLLAPPVDRLLASRPGPNQALFADLGEIC